MIFLFLQVPCNYEKRKFVERVHAHSVCEIAILNYSLLCLMYEDRAIPLKTLRNAFRSSKLYVILWCSMLSLEIGSTKCSLFIACRFIIVDAAEVLP